MARNSKRHICAANGCEDFALFKQRLCFKHYYAMRAAPPPFLTIHQRRLIARVQESRPQNEKTKRILIAREC